MIRYLIAALALTLASPVFATTHDAACAPGQDAKRQHGKWVCVGVATPPVQPTVDPWAINPPRITTPDEAGGSLKKAARRTNLRQAQAFDAYALPAGDNPEISDVVIGRSRYGVTMRQKDGSYTNVTSLAIRRVEITASEAPIYIRGGSHDITIEDARLTCTGTSSGIPGGVKIGSKGSPPNYNITLNRVLISGCASSADRQGYKQGDGFVSERPDYNLTLHYVRISGVGDGLIDTKSSKVTLDQVQLSGGNYGIRGWAQGEATDVWVSDVRKAGFQMKPSTNWHIRYWHNAKLGAPYDVVTDGAGGTLTIDDCDRPIVTRIAKGSVVNAGGGCKAR